MVSVFAKYKKVLEDTDPVKYNGKVVRVAGSLIESLGPRVILKELCYIHIPKTGKNICAEVAAINGSYVQLMTFESAEGIEAGCTVVGTGETLSIRISDKILGRIIDGTGNPIDGKGSIGSGTKRSVFNTPPDVLRRKPVSDYMETGIRAIDSLLTVGKGQRLGIFSPAGTGKSTLLGMIARNTDADVNVIAIVGERGREVSEFIKNNLGSEKLKKSVVVVSSSDTSPIARVRGGYTATAIAEYFRDKGKNVMLFFDSLTRFARAQREIGLAVGEHPATRGFPPSVFSEMPKLLERCSNSEYGTLTGFYTVLVEGDDMNEPVSDNAEGFLDGHIILTRKLSESNRFPAIDVLKSISRSAEKIAPAKLLKAAGYIRRYLAVYRDAEDLINVGAYVKGSNAEIDKAIEKNGEIGDFLCQELFEKSSFDKSFESAVKIAESDHEGGGISFR